MHLSADSEPVVFDYGEVTSRVCSDRVGIPFAGRLPVRTLRLEELQAFEVGQLKQPRFPGSGSALGLHMPSLREVLEWKAKEAPALRLNLEIKREPGTPRDEAERLVRSCLALLREHGVLGESLVSRLIMTW